MPIEQIDFDIVQEFCDLGLAERLDLDYKSNWPNDLGKILCGMANVQGGIILLGIDTEEDTHRPTWPPPGVDGTEDKLNQQVVQIAYDAIYPPIIPEVAICPLPTDAEKAVVVIRIDASNLVHAVDGRKKVYVRIADHSRGYDLANLSEIEWLWDKRAKSIEFRNHLLARATNRANNFFKANWPRFILSAVPVFPNQIEAISSSDLLNVANRFPDNILPWAYSDKGWRTVADGVYALARWNMSRLEAGQYSELGGHGLVHFQQLLETPTFKPAFGDEGPPIQGIQAFEILQQFENILRLAVVFYEQIKWSGPIMLEANLNYVQKLVLDSRVPQMAARTYYPHNQSCPDDIVNLYGKEINVSALVNEHETMLADFASKLMWAFGYGSGSEEIQIWLAKMKHHRVI